jgi:hypothetical protein
VFDLDNYELLFSKSDKEVQQVKTGWQRSSTSKDQ